MTDGNRLRVLVSAECFVPEINGVTNSVLRTIDHLDAGGHAVAVVAPGPGPAWVRCRSGTRVPVHRVPSVRVPMYRTLRAGIPTTQAIDDVVRGFRPDIVHLAAPMLLGRMVGAVARQRGLPSIAVFQTDISGFLCDYGLRVAASPAWSWLRRIHNRADRSLAPTGNVAAELRGRGFERVGVWGRGVDHGQFDPARRSEEFRARCGVRSADDVLIGYVGRLAAEKRVERLACLRQRPGVHVVVVGEGPKRSDLQRLLPHVTFTGFLEGEELGAAMASLDVFVHTGEHETFGQTIQEAMSAGVAVVAPACGGPLDLIESGRTGLLYRPGADTGLRNDVDRLTLDPAERRRLAENGRRAVADRSWQALGAELVGHYRELVDRELAAA